MKIIVVAGSPEQVSPLPTGDYYIGADQGAMAIIRQRLPLYLAIGDFDSVTPEEWRDIEKSAQHVEEFGAEKDETDLELAVQRAIELNPDEIILTQVTGGRLDHYMSAIHLMYRCQRQYAHIRFQIRDTYNIQYFLPAGKHDIIRDERYPYVSFFAWERGMTNVTLRGVKYEVTNDEIPLGSTRFTSNEIVASNATIAFELGTALVMHSREDEKKA